MKVVAKWFFEHDADPPVALEQSRLVQSFHRDGHGVRWQRQVEHPVLRHIVRTLQPSDVRGQRLIVLWPPFMQGLVVKTLVAPDAQLCFIAPARLLQAFEGPEPKPLFSHIGQGGADDQGIASFQDSLVPQMIQRRQELPTRQIAGPTDDDKNVGLNLMFRHLQAPPYARSPVSYKDAEPVRQRQRPWRVKRETCEKGAIRSSGFAVPKTSNFGPRTLARPASLARLSCRGVLISTQTCRPAKF